MTYRTATTDRPNTCIICGHLAFRQNDTWATDGRPGAHPTTVMPEGDTVHKACQHEAEYDRAHFPAEATLVDGVWVWDSSGNAVPAEVLRNALRPAAEVEAQAAAKAAADRAFLASLRSKPLIFSDEDRAEMRAEFGPGATVVNVLTGQRFTV